MSSKNNNEIKNIEEHLDPKTSTRTIDNENIIKANLEDRVSTIEKKIIEECKKVDTIPEKFLGRIPIDPCNPSITRDDSKCILCGKCIYVCQKEIDIMLNYELPLKDDIPCIHCGQCTLWCPTNSITETDDTEKVLKALEDSTLHVIVQTAPSTRVALGEEFGLEIGTNFEAQQVAALKMLGFDSVFDTNFGADMTIMEEADELVKRLRNKNKELIPQFTSCCPSWVKYCEYYYPDLLSHLSTAKSPMHMLGTMSKTYYAKEANIDPKKIVSVAIMPCTAKKFEAAREEFNNSEIFSKDEKLRSIDYVLTTRELARIVKEKNIDIKNIPPGKYDPLMSKFSGGGAIFGVTGGVMEAAIRTAYYMISGKRPPELLLNFSQIRGLKGVKEATLNMPTIGEIKVAAITGIENAKNILEETRNGNATWDFIEFMACYGGCVSGGGQPKSTLYPTDNTRKVRGSSLYKADEKAVHRSSYENEEIIQMYKNYLGKPGSEISHKLLHVHFRDRSMHLNSKCKKK